MWSQGEHVTVVGKTGSGKTSFLHSLLKLRAYVLMLATKDDDLPKIGWRLARKEEQIDPKKGTHWRLQPAFSEQRKEFSAAIHRVAREGAWCIDIDELYRVVDLDLRDDVVQLLTQGRSDKISVVSGIQRPASRDIPREAWSEATHIFCFGLTDGRDREVIRQQVSRSFESLVVALPRFHYAYVNTVTGEMQEGIEANLKDVLGYPSAVGAT